MRSFNISTYLMIVYVENTFTVFQQDALIYLGTSNLAPSSPVLITWHSAANVFLIEIRFSRLINMDLYINFQ